MKRDETPQEQTVEPAVDDAEPRGLTCPRCGCRHLHVLYVRSAILGRKLRRRECRHCGKRFTSTEKIV